MSERGEGAPAAAVPRPEGRADRWLSALVGVGVGAGVATTLLVAVALAVFAHPNGDDFCVGADQQEVGLLGCVRRAYELQGGRWAGYVVGCALEATAPLTDQYPIGPWLMLACVALAAWFLLVSVLPLQGNRRLAGSLTLTLLALYWAGTPEPGQTFYWLDGSVAYSLNLALSMVLVGCLARFPAGRSRGRAGAVLALGLLALVTAGFHELLALVLAVVLATGAGVAFLRRDPRRLAWLVACVGLLVGFVTVAVAPGNVLRERGVQSNVQHLGGALRETAEMWLRVVDMPVARGTNTGSYGRPLGWILDPKLLAATLLFASCARVRSLRPRWVPVEPHWKLVFPAAWLASLTGAFLGGGVVLGATLPPRVFNSLYLVFLLGWFLTVFVYTRSDEPGSVRPGEKLLQAACAAIFALGLVFSTNVKHGVRDLVTGRAAAYDRAMTHRYEAARALRAGGGDHLVVPAIEPWPSSYYENDLQEDPQGVQNHCWARYFGLASIRRAGEGPSPSGSPE